MSWVLRTSFGGRVTDETIGRWPEMPLKQARQVARSKRKAIGLEPPRGYVFADAFRLWVGLKKGRIVSYRDERRMLERYILPALRNRQLDEITAPLIVQIVRPIDAAWKRVSL